ncbi:hypothetical protein [Mammaliicoccus vitulinus]|nr:hypothetical protein [Mammaliicoccus vitulinus]
MSASLPLFTLLFESVPFAVVISGLPSPSLSVGLLEDGSDSSLFLMPSPS